MSSPRAKALLVLAAAVFGVGAAAYKTKRLDLTSLKKVTNITFNDVLRLFSFFYQAFKRNAENARRSVHETLQKKQIRWLSTPKPVTKPTTEGEEVDAESEDIERNDMMEETLRDLPIKEEPDFDGVVKGLEVLEKASEPTGTAVDVYEESSNYFGTVESCVPDEDSDPVQGVFYRKALTLDTIPENENEASDNLDCGKEISVSL